MAIVIPTLHTPPPYAGNMGSFRNQTDLPQYSAGFDIKKSTGASTQDIDINIINKKSHYDIGDIVEGSISIKPYRDMEFSQIVIYISMSEEIAKPAGPSSARSFAISKYIPPPSYYPPDLILRKGFSYTFSFALEIPDILESEVCKHNIHSHTRLPPSIGSSPTGDPVYDLSDLSARLYYSVRARIMHFSGRTQKCMSHNKVDIRISPSHPPLPIYERPNPYRTVTVLKSGKFRKSCRGTLELRVPNVPIIFMKSCKPAKIDLQLLYSSDDRNFTGSFHCSSVSYKFISHTISSHIPIPEQPVPGSKSAHTHSEVLDTRKLGELALNWTQYRKNEYGATVLLPVLSPSHQRMAPTFFSCLISRQYQLRIDVVFEGCAASIEIPIVVC